MLKNVAQILALSAFCLATSAPSSSFAETEVTIEDIDKFGWEYIGKYVSLFAILEDIESANHPKNRGRIVATLQYDGDYSDDGMFAEGWGRKEINPLLGKCLKLSGFVEEVAANYFGNETTIPTLIIDHVEEMEEEGSCDEELERILEEARKKIKSFKIIEEDTPKAPTETNSEAEEYNPLSDALNAPIVNVD
jgi:hypothetical protein